MRAMQVVWKGLLGLAVLSALASCRIDTKGLGAQDAGLAEIELPSPDASGTMTGGAGTGVAGAAAGTSGKAGAGGVSGGVAGSGPAGTGAAGQGAAGQGEAGEGQAGTGAAGAGEAGQGEAGKGEAGAGEAGMGAAGNGAAGTGAAGIGAAGAGAAGTGAAGSASVSKAGCADGTREGFVSLDRYPNLAACAGAWTVPGFVGPETKMPQCQRHAGNDGTRADGMGCSVADLCAEGWHVCESINEFKTSTSSCLDGYSQFGGTPVFFATRQRGSGMGTVTCDPKSGGDGTNNVYGCGNIGSAPDGSCAPFNRMLRDNDCRNNRPWACEDGPINYNVLELSDITKPGKDRGGVLCCR
jgi:PPE-repeat protein